MDIRIDIIIVAVLGIMAAIGGAIGPIVVRRMLPSKQDISDANKAQAEANGVRQQSQVTFEDIQNKRIASLIVQLADKDALSAQKDVVIAMLREGVGSLQITALKLDALVDQGETDRTLLKTLTASLRGGIEILSTQLIKLNVVPMWTEPEETRKVGLADKKAKT
jgi:hypothetical protein